MSFFFFFWFTFITINLMISRFSLELRDKMEFCRVETGVWIRTGVSDTWTWRMTRYTLCSPSENKRYCYVYLFIFPIRCLKKQKEQGSGLQL